MARSAETSASGPETQASRGESPARRRIDDEHRRLNELLRSLTHSHDPVRLQTLLGELRELLVEHFEHEEATDGLHELVTEGAAHRMPNLQHLFEEHREILKTVDALVAQIGAIVDGAWREVRDGVSDLAETLRRHERDEEDLFSEAFYSDLGRV
ncbi:MAG: hemerythrin domain-containing protein [Acidobacteria bacterium]|nr:hemerythrin domain-containing protein [Acidobacteriota bacterium]